MVGAYRVIIEPVDRGTLSSSSNTIINGTSPFSEGVPHRVVVKASSVQIQGIMGYLGEINAGLDTSTVETAITAVGP